MVYVVVSDELVYRNGMRMNADMSLIVGAKGQDKSVSIWFQCR